MNSDLRAKSVHQSGLRIGVTGAAGYIGAALVEHLLKQGVRVKALDQFSNGVSAPSWKNQVALYDIDLSAPNPRLNDFAHDLDFVFDLAAIADVHQCEREGTHCLLQNAVARYQVLKALEAEGVSGYLLPSSVAAVYGNPQKLPISEGHAAQPVNTYGLSKLWAEQTVQMIHRSFPLKAVIVRQSNVYGPSPVFRPAGVIHQFLSRALQGQDLEIYGQGNQCRDFVFLPDLVKAYDGLMHTALNRNAGIITVNVAGEVCRINELAQQCIKTVSEKTGSQVSQRHKQARLEADAEELDVDTSFLSEILGEWSPTPLRRGLDLTLGKLMETVTDHRACP